MTSAHSQQKTLRRLNRHTHTHTTQHTRKDTTLDTQTSANEHSPAALGAGDHRTQIQYRKRAFLSLFHQHNTTQTHIHSTKLDRGARQETPPQPRTNNQNTSPTTTTTRAHPPHSARQTDRQTADQPHPSSAQRPCPSLTAAAAAAAAATSRGHGGRMRLLLRLRLREG